MKIAVNATIESKWLDDNKLLKLFDCEAADGHNQELIEAILPENNYWCYVDLEINGQTIPKALVAVYEKQRINQPK